jgi:hypothetical protein
VKLSHWARKHGMGYLTAWRWLKAAVRDLLEILTSTCGRLYGKRPARNLSNGALESICG